MKEIGGYIQLDTYTGEMLHEEGILLNSGRNCLLYLAEAKHINKIRLPYFLCDSVYNSCVNAGIKVKFYHVDMNFMPEEPQKLDDDEWLYIVDYYGQLSDECIASLKQKYNRIVLDYTQSYFRKPLNGVDTLYTCRKFFGVTDGAVLYSDTKLERELETDESYSRMEFLLGRYERVASDFYPEYVNNNKLFAKMPVRKMSRLTYNLLHAINYDMTGKRRENNFNVLASLLGALNGIDVNSVIGPFAYPLYVEDGAELRKYLISNKIYIPLLWPNVIKDMPDDSVEYRLANNILPLPCDQRYDEHDMEYIADMILQRRKIRD